MVTKKFIDKDGVFFLTLLKGAKTGYDVFRMMGPLYQADSSTPLDLQNANTRVESIIQDEKKELLLFPCIIIVKRDFLRQWLEAERKNFEKLTDVEEIRRVTDLLKDLQAHADLFDRNLKNTFSFFNNSSIWVRVVNWDDTEIEAAQKELEYFKNIGLYEYGSAKENLDYNIRLQNENYLDSRTQGHGIYVTPVLYGDECEFLQILKGNKKTL